MPPLVARTEGFIADIRTRKVCPRPSHGHRYLLTGFAIALVLLLALQLLLSHGGSSNRMTSPEFQPAAASSNYSWRVYYLNETSRMQQANGTSFSFRTDDLPFDFSSIEFGDFRNDLQHISTYYGGCGILVNASGSSAVILLMEADGKLVTTVQYYGQDPIVFSGERKSVSYPNETTSYFGTDKIAQDWRNGTWSPDQGILVGHPMNVSLASSRFCLMVFEPAGSSEIPEFGLVPVIITCCIIVFATGRRNR
jgi:hypothetical protein